MPGRCYVDTSAYLALILGEEQASELAELLRGAELLSSVLLVLEANRNLVRLSREGLLPTSDLHRALDRLREDMELFVLRDLTLDLCTGTRLPAVTTPRTLDLAHLRTALWFHERAPLDLFVSLDETQLHSARELDLPIGGRRGAPGG